MSKKKADVCLWRENSDGYWQGQCGITWCFEVGGPTENGMMFCPECGAETVVYPCHHKEGCKFLAAEIAMEPMHYGVDLASAGTAKPEQPDLGPPECGDTVSLEDHADDFEVFAVDEERCWMRCKIGHYDVSLDRIRTIRKAELHTGDFVMTRFNKNVALVASVENEDYSLRFADGGIGVGWCRSDLILIARGGSHEARRVY